jgi:phosphoglycolate phosphatase
VATGKGREGLNKAWQDTHSGQYFVSSRSADDALSKPSPDMLQQILQELGLMPNEVLMVGDTTYDMAMAEAINVDRVAVSFGVHEAQRLQQHKPLAIIDKLEDLLNFV